MIVYIINIFLIIYAISMLLTLFLQERIAKDLDDSGEFNGGIFTNQFMVNFVALMPFLNTLFILAVFKDWLVIKYAVWRVKKTLKSLKHKLNPELQKEIDELLND